MSAPYYQGNEKCAANPYSKASPTGFLNLRLAETNLSEHLFQQKLAACHQELGNRLANGEQGYGYSSSGNPAFKTSLASYFSRVLKIAVDPMQVILGAGATALVEHVVFALLEPSDGLL